MVSHLHCCSAINENVTAVFVSVLRNVFISGRTQDMDYSITPFEIHFLRQPISYDYKPA